MAEGELPETELQRAYDRGFTDGLETYAWWRDGQQYVGTTGTTLLQAVDTRKQAWNYDPPTDDQRIQVPPGAH